MPTPPLFLGSKFKVLSLVGLSGSGIIGSFSAIHKSADRASETIDPAKAAIRKGLGYMFSGASQMGSQADEWLGYLAEQRFVVISFIGRHVQRIGSGQKSMVDQGQDWVRQVKKAVNDYLKKWLDMLPYLFYFWDRKRSTLLGDGINETEIRDDLVRQILEGNDQGTLDLSRMLLDSEDLRKGIEKLSELMNDFKNNYESVKEDSRSKAEKAREEAFTSFGEKIGKAIQDMASAGEDEAKFTKALKDIVQIPQVVDEKFKAQGLEDDEEAKKAQESTRKLMDWIISDLFLPMFTDVCDDSQSNSCTSVEVLADDEEQNSDDKQDT